MRFSTSPASAHNSLHKAFKCKSGNFSWQFECFAANRIEHRMSRREEKENAYTAHIGGLQLELTLIMNSLAWSASNAKLV